MSSRVKHLECACTDMSHTLRFSYEPMEDCGDNPPWPPTLYAEIYMSPARPWYYRVWPAIKFLFGSNCSKHGHFGSWMMHTEDALELARMVVDFADESIRFKREFPNVHFEEER